MISSTYRKPLQLGKGSYGCVWSNNKNTAVKITKLDSWDKLQSTVREVHALRQLSRQHEHLFVRMKKVTYSKKQLHVFMERADCNLHDMKRKDLNAATIEKWAIQLFKMLNTMNKRKIHHRDIKPENVLVRNNDIFLCDFGLSRQLHSDPEFGTGYIITRWYRAPELLKHQKQHKRKPNLIFTEKMDVWSIGVILYELIFDKVLAPGKTVDDALKYVERRVPKMQQADIVRHEKITDKMARCLKGVLQMDPAKRYDSQHALYSLGIVTAEEYIEHQRKVMEKSVRYDLQYADIRPEDDRYTSEEWQKRQQYAMQAYKKFQTKKKVIAYALYILDTIYVKDIKATFAKCVVYASLVFGSYYNDTESRKMVKTYRGLFDELEDDDEVFEELSNMLIKFDSTKMSAWESRKWSSFSKFLSETLKNPFKRIKT